MFEKRGGRKKCKTFPLRKRRFARRKGANAKKDWSRAAYPPQRSLRAALGCYPTTAGGAQFCLLCCQPGPVPESLPARPPPLTKGRPCRPPVWLGHPIHTASRTCHGPQRFISQVPMRGTGRHDPPQRKCCVGKSRPHLRVSVGRRLGETPGAPPPATRRDATAAAGQRPATPPTGALGGGAAAVVDTYPRPRRLAAAKRRPRGSPGGASARARGRRDRGSRGHTTLAPLRFRIPFGDHPLKLERYRED